MLVIRVILYVKPHVLCSHLKMAANCSFADSFIIDTKLILGKDIKFKLTVNLLFNKCLGLSVCSCCFGGFY